MDSTLIRHERISTEQNPNPQAANLFLNLLNFIFKGDSSLLPHCKKMGTFLSHLC